MIKCIKFLFCIVIIASSCTDSSFEEDQNESQNNLEEMIEKRGLCSEIDYVLVGVHPAGTPEEACQIATCAAWYDLQYHYETRVITTTFQHEEFTGDLDDDGRLEVTSGYVTTTRLKLNKESVGNYLSYLKTLKDNFNGDPVNDEYWAIFIDCYINTINP